MIDPRVKYYPWWWLRTDLWNINKSFIIKVLQKCWCFVTEVMVKRAPLQCYFVCQHLMQSATLKSLCTMYMHFSERAIWIAAGQYTFTECIFLNAWTACKAVVALSTIFCLWRQSIPQRRHSVLADTTHTRGRTHTHFHSFNGRKSISFSGRRNSIR